MVATKIDLEQAWSRRDGERRPQGREALITRYAYLVKYVVGRLGIGLPVILDLEDARSYGVIGLIDAVDRFDTTRGVKFETFAIPIIKAAIIGALRSLDIMPRSSRKKARLIYRAMASLAQELGREPTDEEVAASLEMSMPEYWKVLTDASWTAVSFDHPSSQADEDDQTMSLLDVVGDPTSPDPVALAERRDLQDAVAAAIDLLPDRERMILSLYYHEELTLREIGEVLSVSECRVSQLHARAIARIRRRINP